MQTEQSPFRHIHSPRNPALIESWCPGCGVFIAASNDVKKLVTAENIHSCPRDLGNGSKVRKKKVKS